MIIWLSSYPRSGNTLLRTIIKSCFDISSFSDEPVNYESEFRTNPELIGHCELEGEWSSFYPKAVSTEKIFLVKTLLADFLYQQIKRDWIDREGALWVAREWLHDAAARRY